MTKMVAKMVIVQLIIITLLSSPLCVSLVSGKFTLSFQFHRYSNPSLLDAAGECCDYGFFTCGHCETAFQSLCLRTGPTSNTAVGQCISGTIYNPGRVGGDTVNFGNRVGSLDNPFSYTRNVISQVGYQLYLEVYDEDDVTNNDLLDRIVVPIPGQLSSVTSRTYAGIFGRASLTLSYTLSCNQHYYGSDCSVYCIPHNDAQNGHYTCNVTTGAIICKEGWQNVTNNCRDVACDLVCQPQGGNCTANGVCNCSEGWSGKNCEVPQCTEGCNPQGGFCKSPNTCTCRPNWNGTLCNVTLCNVNCSSVGGECNEPDECTCSEGYTGQACETDLVPCDHQMPCRNEGNCTHTSVIGQYTCSCMNGFTGTNCEVDIDECSVEEPCMNNGTCVNGDPGTFKCICPTGWTGELCDDSINYCEPSPCTNNGTCVPLGTTGYYCTCSSQFEGRNCELMVNACSPNPCLNNGTCMNMITNFTCTCMEGYTGHNCALNVSMNATNSQGNSTSAPGSVKIEASIIGAAAGGGALLIIIFAALISIIIIAACLVTRKRKNSVRGKEDYGLVSDKKVAVINTAGEEVEYDVPDKDLLKTLANSVYGETGNDNSGRYTYAKLNHDLTPSSNSSKKHEKEIEPLHLNSDSTYAGLDHSIEKIKDTVPNPAYGYSSDDETVPNPAYGYSSDDEAVPNPMNGGNNGNKASSPLEKGEEGMYNNPLYGGTLDKDSQPTYDSISENRTNQHTPSTTTYDYIAVTKEKQ